jgi:hypothetical protein
MSDELLALRMGNATVAENLRRAVDAGRLIEHPDGRFELSAPLPAESDWVIIRPRPPLNCAFYRDFLFRKAYDRSAVPLGCSACYKVHVEPKTLRELVAACEIGRTFACISKWGVNFRNRHSNSIYSGVFYANGLDMARTTFKTARQAFDREPRLGPALKMTIKRGCSEYEKALGPSDRYQFRPELEELEAYLFSRFVNRAPAEPPAVPQARWIEVAASIGDDTYLDFTGGKYLPGGRKRYEP